MCDANHILEPSSAYLPSMLSLMPGNTLPYLTLGVASTSFLARVTTELNTGEKTLAHAKATCMRNYLALTETETRFLRTKLTASKLQTRLLEVHDLGWKDYLHNIIAISRCLVILERDVRDIQKSLLVLIEATHRRKLAEDINKTQAVLHGAMYRTTASGYEV
ncbi:hypothetical protein C8R45DRAFT_1155276 [Mycena sanguinolenta]|nr:hypothetical protein C8R45DRAFT_1155276 [Mycena sanguinolenta]